METEDRREEVVSPKGLGNRLDPEDPEGQAGQEGSVDPGGLEALEDHLFLGRLYLFLPFDRVLEHLVWEVHRRAWVRRVFQPLAWELPAYWLGSLWAVREDYFWVAHLPARTAAGFLEAFARSVGKEVSPG